MTKKKLQSEAVKCVKRIVKTAQKLAEIENLYAQQQVQTSKIIGELRKRQQQKDNGTDLQGVA